jgi:hypothetical protein
MELANPLGASMTQDRIREFRRVLADELLPDPQIRRRHPKTKKAALQVVLEKIGFGDAVLALEDDEGKLVLIDGHHRADIVKRPDVPAFVLDVDEEKAADLLAQYRPVGSDGGERLGSVVGPPRRCRPSARTGRSEGEPVGETGG